MLALSIGILAGGRPLFAIRWVKACSLAPKLRSNPDSYEPCGWRMTYDRHLAAAFRSPARQIVRRLRHSVSWPHLSSVLEAWSHCGETVPRSDAHGHVTTFWAFFAHSIPDDDGMTSIPICPPTTPAWPRQISEVQANRPCQRFCSELYLIVARFRRGFVRSLCAPRAWNGSACHWSRFCRRCAKGFASGRVEEVPLRLGVEEVPLRLECVAPGTPCEWVTKMWVFIIDINRKQPAAGPHRRGRTHDHAGGSAIVRGSGV